MINCLKCPRIRKQPGLIYCPFLGQQPCLHGYHEVPQLKKIKIQVKPDIVIPDFIKPKRPGKIDWQKHHKLIFTMFYGGYSIEQIAEKIKTRASNVLYYLDRYSAARR